MTTISEKAYRIDREPSEAFVFVQEGGGWAVAGRVQVASPVPGRPQATFTYARSWRERKDAFALDPVNLPLTEAPVTKAVLHGAFMDSLPDRWGQRLFDARFGRMLADFLGCGTDDPRRLRLPSHLDRLILGADDRVGALAYGPTPVEPMLFPADVPVRKLAALEAAMARFDAGHQVEEDIRLMATGTSLGGARPKCSVVLKDGSEWIAKFRKHEDTVDAVRVEHASMTLAAAAGIEAAETRVVSLGAREALLVRRFDREPDGVRHPYLSAQSLLGLAETDLAGGYPGIADRMRCAGCPPEDLAQLFRRMAFNTAVGNQDDHMKNHGLLRDGGGWRLTPAFDVLPTPDGNGYQAIDLGVMGGMATLANVLSRCGSFGLARPEAEEICREVGQAVAGWRDHFAAHGVGEGDILRISRCVQAGFPDSLPGAGPKP
jgi:serine/threonine-protein kinase HipA